MKILFRIIMCCRELKYAVEKFESCFLDMEKEQFFESVQNLTQVLYTLFC